MAIIFYILLMLRVGRCTDDHILETKTVGDGQKVTLICTRQASGDIESFFWIKVVAGKLPEVLGRAFSFDTDNVNGISRITSKLEPGRFVLHISNTRLRDTALYYCLKSQRFNITFLKGTFLRIKGPEPHITAIIQDFPSNPVRPGDSVTLQCSVLSDYDNKTCPGDHSVYWFRAGSDESHPRLIYAQRNNGGECEKSPEDHSAQKCVYNFSKTINSSDAGTYYCAVATCGEILFGNGTKLDTEVVSICDSREDNTIVFLLCAALAVSLIVIAFLVYAIMKKSCDHCDAAATLQTNAATARGDQQSQQRNEDSLVYSAANFTRKKAGKERRRNGAAKEETTYSDVRLL